MKVNYVRLYNLGNYENERVELEDEVLPDETPQQAIKRLAALVAQARDELHEERRRPAQRSEIPF